MARTDLDVCNRSIGLVGGEPIAALDDSTPLGEFCAVEYRALRDGLLAGYRWVFAGKIAPLTQRVSPPEDPRTCAYERPNDLVGAIHAFRDAPGEAGCLVEAFQLADYIAADAAALWAEYTCQVAEARWPPWFEQLAVTAFAVPLARRVGKRSLASELDVAAYGPPEMNRRGGLMLDAQQADARNAPARALRYDGGGALAAARVGVGVSNFGMSFAERWGIG